MLSSSEQIKVSKTLDVEAVERQIAALWVKTAGVSAQQEGAVMRARVANLMIFTSTAAKLEEINAILTELSAAHPCRALVVASEREGVERDIEIYISSGCHSGVATGTKCVFCEAITLVAGGKFVEELPSATLPLLIPDLPVFLWWTDSVSSPDSLFAKLCRGADRLIIDSVDFVPAIMDSVAQLASSPDHGPLGISDINWARLTSWRALLASFYDVPQYRPALERLSAVEIDYVATESGRGEIVSQALLMAGWLASRLKWEPILQSREINEEGLRIKLNKKGRQIELKLSSVERSAMRPGRLARVEFKSDGERASLSVARSASGLHIETHANLSAQVQPGQLLPVRNRSTAQLLGREMEILTNDDIYAESLELGAAMLK
jgi:glucose-6-phosphate dehydrogenase assembly protein OpcA